MHIKKAVLEEYKSVAINDGQPNMCDVLSYQIIFLKHSLEIKMNTWGKLKNYRALEAFAIILRGLKNNYPCFLIKTKELFRPAELEARRNFSAPRFKGVLKIQVWDKKKQGRIFLIQTNQY